MLLPAGHKLTFSQVVQEALSSKVAFFANLIGLLGLFPLIYGLSSISGASARLGVSDGIITAIVGVPILLALGFYSLWNIARAYHRENERLARQLDETQESLRETERNAATLPRRLMQQRALEALSVAFGYHLHQATYHHTIREDGSSDGHYQVKFQCNRRSLSKWVRMAKSSLVQLGGCGEASMPNRKVTIEKRELPDKRLVEQFRFVPSIDRTTPDAVLAFSTKQPAGTFLTRLPNSAGRDYDWVSVAPREPMATLKIRVDFVGFVPQDLECEAIHGPGGSPLFDEQTAMEESLRHRKDGPTHIVEMELQYPILAVEYRLRWKLT